jgi:hypothetical protein
MKGMIAQASISGRLSVLSVLDVLRRKLSVGAVYAKPLATVEGSGSGSAAESPPD